MVPFRVRLLISVCLLSVLCTFVFPQDVADQLARIDQLQRSYPDVKFVCRYEPTLSDIEIVLTSKNEEKRFVLFWSGGRMLPAEELVNMDDFCPIVYEYPVRVEDPLGFTADRIAEIREMTSKEARRKGAITPTFFFDIVYDSSSRAAVTNHIKTTTFLGKKLNVHEKIIPPLKKVENNILLLAKTDAETKNFVNRLSAAQGFNWREIRDRNAKSFHSMGVAIDVLPSGWKQKNVYWAWRRDVVGDSWLFTPLDRRWMPPDAVIDAFEQEGFVWGGKWEVWDNMHFEYRPEIIAASKEQ